MKVVAHTRSYKALSCLWDGGADISLITNSKARQLNLKGKPIKLYVTTAGGHKSVVDSMAYVLVLRDKMGYTHSLRVYGFDKITSDVAKFELNSIVKQFENISLQDVERPCGEVDLLIGFDYAGWHPIPEQANGHLIILSNIFGKCVGGRCPLVNKSTTKAVLTASIVNILLSGGPIDEFMTVESLGIQCNPKCGNCKCGSCPIGGKPYSLKEERELKLIENNLEFHGQ